MDDGTPEASDDDNNYIGYDQTVPGSYKRAVAEANLRRAPTAINGAGMTYGADRRRADQSTAPLQGDNTPAVTGTMGQFYRTLKRLMDRTQQARPLRHPVAQRTRPNTFLTFGS